MNNELISINKKLDTLLFWKDVLLYGWVVFLLLQIL
jgi:hypothetical protein